MLMPTIIGVLVGMVLAQRFKVLALFPVIVLTLFVASSAAIVHPTAAWTLGLITILMIVGLQLGYLFGIGIRHVTLLTRASRRRATSLARSLSPQRPAH